jgi:hypothetical protein
MCHNFRATIRLTSRCVFGNGFPPQFACDVSILHYLMTSTAPASSTLKERRGEIQSSTMLGRREIQSHMFYGFSVLKVCHATVKQRGKSCVPYNVHTVSINRLL